MKSSIIENLQRKNQRRQQAKEEQPLSLAGFSMGEPPGYPSSLFSPLYSPSEKKLPGSPKVNFLNASHQEIHQSHPRLNSPGPSRQGNREQPQYSPSPIQIALEQQRKISELETHTSQLSTELDSTKNELAMRDDTIEMLKKELAKAQQYVASHEKLLEANVKIDHYDRENKSLTNDNQALQVELQTIKASYAELLEINRGLTNKLEISERSKLLARTGQASKDSEDVIFCSHRPDS